MIPNWAEVTCTMHGKRMVNLNNVTNFFATGRAASGGSADTAISMVDGERIMVRESYDTIALLLAERRTATFEYLDKLLNVIKLGSRA